MLVMRTVKAATTRAGPTPNHQRSDPAEDEEDCQRRAGEQVE